jgi:hypothetical protein
MLLTKDILIKQAEQMVENDRRLVVELSKMNQEDKEKFLPQVEKSMKETSRLLETLKN